MIFFMVIYTCKTKLPVDLFADLTRNADVVRDAMGLGRSRHAKQAWQDSWWIQTLIACLTLAFGS